MRSLRLAAWSSVLAVSGAQAQEVVLRAERMVDVRTGSVVSRPTILIEGDRVVAINPTHLPTTATIIDAGNLTLVPGYIDLYVSFTPVVSGTDAVLQAARL